MISITFFFEIHGNSLRCFIEKLQIIKLFTHHIPVKAIFIRPQDRDLCLLHFFRKASLHQIQNLIIFFCTALYDRIFRIQNNMNL